MIEPDWGELLCVVCRHYPAYDLERCGELTVPQLRELVRHIPPALPVVLVEVGG